MGSAVLGEAISAIRDWSVTEAKEPRGPRATEAFGSLVFNDEVQQTRLPKPVYHALRRTITHGEPLDVVGGRRRRDGDEGLGGRARRDALHALVPAADRHHRRKARLVSVADRRRQGGRGVLGQGTDQGRARRVELPVRRHALHLRGARLHGVGSDEPAVAAQERRRRHAGHSDGVRELDRRGARQEDAAAALDGSALEAGGPRPEAVRLDRRARRHDLRPRAGILPDRSLLLPVASRSDQRRPHAVRREAAEGPGARGSVLRRDRRSRDGVHVRRRDRAVQGRRAGEDAPQRSGAEPVRDRAGVRERQRRHRSSDDDDGDDASGRRRSTASPACCTRSRSPASTDRASTSTGR